MYEIEPGGKTILCFSRRYLLWNIMYGGAILIGFANDLVSGVHIEHYRVRQFVPLPEREGKSSDCALPKSL